MSLSRRNCSWFDFGPATPQAALTRSLFIHLWRRSRSDVDCELVGEWEDEGEFGCIKEGIGEALGGVWMGWTSLAERTGTRKERIWSTLGMYRM